MKASNLAKRLVIAAAWNLVQIPAGVNANIVEREINPIDTVYTQNDRAISRGADGGEAIASGAIAINDFTPGEAPRREESQDRTGWTWKLTPRTSPT